MQVVYCWRNTINGKIYVGSTINAAQRKRHHTYNLNNHKHPNSHLQAAWIKYGAGAFQFEFLELVDNLLWLRAREQAWITSLQACNRDFGYNIASDAWASVSSPETRCKMKQAWIARKTRGDYYKLPRKFSIKPSQKPKRSWSDEQRTVLIKTWTPERKAKAAARARQQWIQQKRITN
jgi:group I intron endonuclease